MLSHLNRVHAMLVVEQGSLVLADSYREEWPYENTDIELPQINPFFEEFQDEDDVKHEIKEEVYEDDL